jgi:hypothetical protein
MSQKRSSDDAEPGIADSGAKRAAALPATLNTASDTAATLPEVPAVPVPRGKFGEGSINNRHAIVWTHVMQDERHFPRIDIDDRGDILLEYDSNWFRDERRPCLDIVELVPLVGCTVKQSPLSADPLGGAAETRMPVVPTPHWTVFKLRGHWMSASPRLRRSECVTTMFPGIPKNSGMRGDCVDAYAYATDGHGTHAILARDPLGGSPRSHVIVCSDAEPFRSMHMPQGCYPHALAFDPAHGRLVLLVYMYGDMLFHGRSALVFVEPLAWEGRQKAEFEPADKPAEN